MKKVYIIHGWEGDPQNNWFPWLKKELESKGFEVFVPEMPDTDKPVKSVWLKTMQELVKNPDANTYLVGHSMGCQAIQRYLESLERSEQSDRGTSNGMKIVLGTLIAGALLYFGYKNFGTPFHRDYMNPHQNQSQNQSQYQSQPQHYGQPQTQTQSQAPQYYVPLTPNIPRNNPNGFTIVDSHSTTRQEGRRGGKYNYGGYSTRQSQTTHTVTPNTPAQVYLVPGQTTAVQSYNPKPCDKAKNYPKPCDKENTLPLPPKPVPEILPTPSPLENTAQASEY